MSASAGSARASRSRILALGDAAMLRGLEQMGRRFDVVANMYEAIGEIASSTASEPVEMLLIDERRIAHSLETIAESVHRLDPGVLVYLVVAQGSAEQFRARASAARFDGVVEAPLEARDIEDDLDHAAEESLRPPAGGARDTSAAERANAQTPRETERQKKHARRTRIELDREFETAQDDARLASSAGAAPTPAPQPSITCAANASGPLGDVDVVEAMLQDPQRGMTVAIAVIEQETGWREVSFEQAPDGCAPLDAESPFTAPVNLGTTTFGLLRAPGRTCAELEPWSAWLARWAALAASQQRLREMAYTDSLTGAWNRRYFDEHFPGILEEARQKRRQIPLMVFDIDNLKVFNDRHGHEAGDTVLRETVRLLKSIVRKGDQVCRIGGDEFVVMFADPDPPRRPGSGVVESVETIARRFQSEICTMKFPKLATEAPGTLSISAGLAIFPWDGADAESLLRVADHLALDSKRRGKNALTIGPGAAAMCGDQ